MAEVEKWNWEQDDWPNFRYNPKPLHLLEAEFLRGSGTFAGALKHVAVEELQQVTVEIMSDEGLNTSVIEGEELNRASLQSSIRRNFGLATDHRKIPLAEQGMAELRVDLYRNFATPLSHTQLYRWHEFLMAGRADLRDIGRYRTGKSPMQIVSGPIHEPCVHYEAPPSRIVKKEMSAFVEWFNRTAPNGATPLPALTRAGLAHWHFVCIHPFADGNGRIGRALSEKSLAQAMREPSLLALSHTINAKRRTYYDALQFSGRDNEVSSWLLYFAKTLLEAQDYSQNLVDFIIAKTKFFHRHRAHLNERQEKVIVRIFREGPAGFKGGLSAEKYIRITSTSRATATRDLQDLVEKKALSKVGELKNTRYYADFSGL